MYHDLARTYFHAAVDRRAAARLLPSEEMARAALRAAESELAVAALADERLTHSERREALRYVGRYCGPHQLPMDWSAPQPDGEQADASAAAGWEVFLTAPGWERHAPIGQGATPYDAAADAAACAISDHDRKVIAGWLARFADSSAEWAPCGRSGEYPGQVLHLRPVRSEETT